MFSILNPKSTVQISTENLWNNLEASPFKSQVAALKAALANASFEKYSAYDLAWQSLHMAAAAACRGSTPSGGTGCCGNSVLVRDITEQKTCRQICAQSGQPNCDAELSIYGYPGKAKQNGQRVGWFYNYRCDYPVHGGKEATGANEDVMNSPNTYFSFCCCRK